MNEVRLGKERRVKIPSLRAWLGQAAVSILVVVTMMCFGPALYAANLPPTNSAPVAPTNSVAKVIAPGVTESDEYDDGKGHSFKLNINTDDEKPGRSGDVFINNHEDKATHERSSLTEDLLDDIIPLTAILASFGTPVLIVFFVAYFKYRRRQENLLMAREYLAKGQPVPPELLDPSQAFVTREIMNQTVGYAGRSDLRKGIRLVFIGLGISIALYVSSPHSTAWGWGLIPAVMGVGFIISGWFESRQTPPRDTPPPFRSGDRL